MWFKKYCVDVPADVPCGSVDTYVKNFQNLTKKTGRVVLFAVDQKIEHLNEDFYGKNIDADALDPKNIFIKASTGSVSAVATHLGLVAKYGACYPNLNYVIKLNGKTNIVPAESKDPLNALLWDVDDVVAFRKSSGLSVCGIGYTLYLGSEYEHTMLAHAAQAIFKAHQYGLIAILWVYPRGNHVANERDPELIAGAAGIGAALGADIVKINPPKAKNHKESTELLSIATQAAGRTKIICSGGTLAEPKEFFTHVHEQMTIGKTEGVAVGRNILQRSNADAAAFTYALSALVIDQVSVEAALNIYKKMLHKFA